jgi:phospholipase C
MYAHYATDTTHIVDIKNLENDISLGNLPSVTIIEPAMHHAAESDDHPIADMLVGQHFIKRVYDALRSRDEIWSSTLLIITYDEHGGFYDHVIPPTADLITQPVLTTPNPSGPGTDIPIKKDLQIPYGVRVPTFVVSPHVPPGKGPDIVLDHCSIIKTILARFCGNDRPFLSDRVEASLTFNSYLTAPAPRLNQVPPSPNLPQFFAPKKRSGTHAIITEPVTKKSMDEGNVDYHQITGMLAPLLGRR